MKTFFKTPITSTIQFLKVHGNMSSASSSISQRKTVGFQPPSATAVCFLNPKVNKILNQQLIAQNSFIHGLVSCFKCFFVFVWMERQSDRVVLLPPSRRWRCRMQQRHYIITESHCLQFQQVYIQVSVSRKPGAAVHPRVFPGGWSYIGKTSGSLHQRRRVSVFAGDETARVIRFNEISKNHGGTLFNFSHK